jgi:hypothetical protein
MLKNPNFDAPGGGSHKCHVYTPDQNGYYETERGEVSAPADWKVWYYHDERPPMHDPDNQVGYAEPEARLAPHDGRYISPPYGYVMFTFYKIGEGGLYQQVEVEPGKRYRFSVHAHAWSSNSDDPSYSEVAGNSGYFKLSGLVDDHALENFTFSVGVDPTGGTNPYASSVIWGTGAHIYNKFHEVPPVEFVAVRSTATVFLYHTVLWPFKHNDAYYDNAKLELVKTHPEPPTPPPGDYDYPYISAGTKLGIHSIGDGGTSDVIEDAMDDGFAVPTVKALNDVGWLADIKRESPETITVARLMHGVDPSINVEGPDFSGDLAAEAELIMNNLMPIWEQHPYVDYWEIINEQDPPGTEGHRSIAEFFKHCISIANANGFKLALFSYSMGVPEWEDWEAIVHTGVFADAKAGGHVLALHEYAYPMDDGFGEPLPGRPTYPDRGTLAFRYRWLYEDFLIPRGEVVPLLITEFNVALPWYTRKISPNEWLDEISWYDEGLCEDYYVLGAHLFTLSSVASTWRNFNFIDWDQELHDYMRSVKDYECAKPPKTSCEPREVYDRTYILIPPDHDFDWVSGLADIWNEKRFTISSSADDAGWGPGTDTTVVALNPDSWNGDLKSFFGEHYPDIEYIPIDAGGPEEFARLLRQYYYPDQSVPWLEYPTTHMPPHITSPFGADRGSYIHMGLDLRSSWAAWGDELVCALPGEVVSVGDLGDFGYTVVVDSRINADDVRTRYAHMVENGAYVQKGDQLKRGDLIGKPDNTGKSYGDHLHIDVRVNGEFVDPAPLILWPEDDGDNSRGVHAPPVTSPPDSPANIAGHLKRLGVKWYKLLDTGDDANVDMCAELLNNDITPIVRLYQAGQFPGNLKNIERAQRLIDVGVQYFEIGNEPNLPNEWRSDYQDLVSWQNDHIVSLVASNWLLDAEKIVSMGGKPAFYAMAPTDRNGTNDKYSAIMWVSKIALWLRENEQDRARSVLNDQGWLAVHAARFNRPLDYSPYQQSFVTDMCLKGYQVYQEQIYHHLSVIPKTISTEGGVYSPSHMNDLGWMPDYDWDTWGNVVVDMYDYVQSETNLLAMCSWHLGDAGVSDPRWLGGGWYDQNWEPRSPVKELT